MHDDSEVRGHGSAELRAKASLVRAGAVRRARTRGQILDALETQLRRDEYRDISISEIAHRADVSVGSVYGHFGNRNRLLLALALDRLGPVIPAHADAAHGSSARERALALGDLLIRTAERTPALLALATMPRDAFDELIAAGDPTAPQARLLLELFEALEHDLGARRPGTSEDRDSDAFAQPRDILVTLWRGLLLDRGAETLLGTNSEDTAKIWATVRGRLLDA